jgi:putative transposase
MAESIETAERLFIEDFDTWGMTGYYLYSKLLRSGVSGHIGTGGSQQRRFDTFRREFNEQRPHEALEQRTPAAVYQPSARSMPAKLPPLEYPYRFEVRYVSANGGIRWNSGWVNVSTTCIGEYVGLEEIDDGIWNIYFGALRLGRLLERKMKVEDAYGRLYRHR